MLIDWFTIIAQALNFILLVWLMKRFLYQPVLTAIDVREKRIAQEIADAEAMRGEAKKERDDFERKNEGFEQRRVELLRQATDEARNERSRLLEDARKAADALAAKRQNTLRSEVQNLNQAILQRTQGEVFAIARKALTDLASANLEDRMVDVFARRLRAMTGQATSDLAKALKPGSGTVVVRSAFDLAPASRATVQHALNETFAAEIPLRFETAPDRVAGIELTLNGQKVAWSIAEYLASLEKDIADLLKKEAKPEASPTMAESA